jgi:UDPglucose 6-dehydrogenase
MAIEHGVEPEILRAVDGVNKRQKGVLAEKIRQHFEGQIRGKVFAVWGLAFKPRTDDIREAPALALIDWLLAEGAVVRVHDPEAMKNVRAMYRDKLTYCDGPIDAASGADALCIMTEWKDYHSPDFAEMYQLMKSPVVFDGRNLYEPERMRRRGYRYYSIGRPAV